MRRRTLLLSVVALAGLAGVAVLGPRVPVEVEAPRVTVPTGSPSGLEDWVRRREAAFDDIVPGAEKRVVWANPEDPGPTPLVVVYLHGFSATRQEVSPLPERLADSLGANLFLTRLTGHGRGPEPMGEATLGSWLGDVAEALAVARELGDQVVLVGTSTGATLALWAAARPGLRERIAALLLISPNLGLPDPRARMLLWPWGGLLARLVEGPERSFEPRNALQSRFWTTRYPLEALLPLMAAVRLVDETSFREIRAPVFIAYDPGDTVVDPRITEARFPELASPRSRLRVVDVPADADRHVLAGDILNPELTEPLVREMLAFTRSAVLNP